MGMFKNTPLQTKITWVIMLTALATLVFAVVALFVLEIGESKDSMTRELNSIAGVIGANSEAALEFDDPKAGAQTLAVLNEDSRIRVAALYTAQGRVFATYASPGNESLIPPVSKAESSFSDIDGIAVFRFIRHNDKQVGTIYINASNYEVYQRLVRHASIGGLVLLLATIAAYFISIGLRNVISRPILRLTETAKMISEHKDYSMRAVKESDDETGILVDQFNRMLDEIGKKSRALENTAHQLQLITDSLPVLIAYVDADERYQFNNASYEKWFNTTRERLRGKKIHEVIGDDEYSMIKPHLQSVFAGRTVTFEHFIDRPGTGRRYISSTLIPDFDVDGSVLGYFGLVTDISERKKSEDELKVLNEALERRVRERTHELEESQERLRHSERLASIGTLAAGVAHEIRNPLNSILLVAQYAQRYRPDLDSAFKEMLGNISNEAKRCATIIKNILLFAKSEKTERIAQDLNAVVRHASDIARGYIGTQRTQLVLQLQSKPLAVALNSTEIEQVLVNLINNAVESTTREVKILIQSEHSGGFARLKITDDGPGIPEDIINHIFDPFFSTKRKKGNTGLGLSLSHGIIADHGGTMSVTSEVGTGTTFIIELPLEKAHEEGLGHR